MHVLAVDTASVSGSVALLKDDCPILETVIHSGQNHSITILPTIASLLKTAKMKITDVDFFALTTGPGSFTGLRIGISLIKGFALGASKPVIGVSTLDALAMNLFASRYPICPLLDAKRGQVYTSLYEPDPHGFPERILPETVEEPRRFLESIRTPVILTGDGIEPYAALIEEVLKERRFIAPPPLRFIRASSVGILALEKFRKGEVLDTMTFTPSYIRLSEVERKEKPAQNS
jgi:tRNA threonylcarbamoyladenosine biosynthesis protein TsaB